MKGIILAGGSGTRLYPLTRVISKQLLPVYDKPMVYYPLATLMSAGISEVLIITTPHDETMFRGYLGDGGQLGIRIQYAVQESPAGIAEALIIGEAFVGNAPVCLILGDNLFIGMDFDRLLNDACQDVSANGGAVVFGYRVQDPQRYGVLAFDDVGAVVGIDEKPAHPKSAYAVVGLYVYDASAASRAKGLRPSARNELEITDLNVSYLKDGRLKAQLLGTGYAWLDAGTHDSLLEAAQYVRILEDRQGIKSGCIEEIAFRNGWISKEALKEAANKYPNQYGQYLLRLI